MPKQIDQVSSDNYYAPYFIKMGKQIYDTWSSENLYSFSNLYDFCYCTIFYN